MTPEQEDWEDPGATARHVLLVLLGFAIVTGVILYFTRYTQPTPVTQIARTPLPRSPSAAGSGGYRTALPDSFAPVPTARSFRATSLRSSGPYVPGGVRQW